MHVFLVYVWIVICVEKLLARMINPSGLSEKNNYISILAWMIELTKITLIN
jgi:hypothetical protein